MNLLNFILLENFLIYSFVVDILKVMQKSIIDTEKEFVCLLCPTRHSYYFQAFLSTSTLKRLIQQKEEITGIVVIWDLTIKPFLYSKIGTSSMKIDNTKKPYEFTTKDNQIRFSMANWWFEYFSNNRYTRIIGDILDADLYLYDFQLCKEAIVRTLPEIVDNCNLSSSKTLEEFF